MFKTELWSWRDSNSRPNEELICFLHAYLRFVFRVTAWPKLPAVTLVPLVSSAVRDVRQTISDTLCATLSEHFEATASG